MTTYRQAATLTEPTMQPIAVNLTRWAGLAAMGAGVIYVGIQPIHPPDILSSVTTTPWIIVHALGVAMCFLGLLGMTGLYARQVNEAGWLGLAGYLLFSLFYAGTLAFQFLEAFIAPVLAPLAPQFVEGLLGLANRHPNEVSLGALPTIYALVAVPYILGGLLFGIATFRASILPRWAAGLLAVGAAVTPVAALVPHPLDRIAAVPVGIALAWLGNALWSERRQHAAAPASVRGTPQLRPAVAE